MESARDAERVDRVRGARHLVRNARPVNHLELGAPYEWINGFYALSSYGGSGGTRGYGQLDFLPPTRDGVFFTRSGVRLADVTDGSSTTLLFGERSHRDPEYDRLTAALDPYFYPLYEVVSAPDP